MVALGQIFIYRVTNPGDTLGTIPSTEKIEFNTSKNTKETTTSSVITNIEITGPHGIGDNQGAQIDLSDKQELGRFENSYIIDGFISNPSLGGLFGIAPDVDKLCDWDEGVSKNSNFKHGRFGIQFDFFDRKSLVPVGTGSNQIGLLWKELNWKLDFAKRGSDGKALVAVFRLVLTVSRGDGT